MHLALSFVAMGGLAIAFGLITGSTVLKTMRKIVDWATIDQKSEKQIAQYEPNLSKTILLKNRKNPSHDVHDAVYKKFTAFGRRHDLLEMHERHFLRAYELDSYLINSGFDAYVSEVSDVEAWQQAEEALAAIGASEMLSELKKIINSVDFVSHYVKGGNQVSFELLEEWDQRLWDGRLGSTHGEKLTYVEGLLDVYVTKHYPWTGDMEQ